MIGKTQGHEFELALFFDRGELQRQLIRACLEAKRESQSRWRDSYRVVDRRVVRGTCHGEVPCAVDAVIELNDRIALSRAPSSRPRPSTSYDSTRGNLASRVTFKDP